MGEASLGKPSYIASTRAGGTPLRASWVAFGVVTVDRLASPPSGEGLPWPSRPFLLLFDLVSLVELQGHHLAPVPDVALLSGHPVLPDHLHFPVARRLCHRHKLLGLRLSHFRLLGLLTSFSLML